MSDAAEPETWAETIEKYRHLEPVVTILAQAE